MMKYIFGRMFEVRGVVVGEKGRRVWVVWIRGYYGGLGKMEGNMLYVLRVVVEDEENMVEEEFVEGFKVIVGIVWVEVDEWRSYDV